MSSLLKEAIVDAKALREAALKNAESKVVEKYSDEVRASMRQLLEQDDLADLGLDDLDLGDDTDPTGAEEPSMDMGGIGLEDETPLDGGGEDPSLDEDTEDVPYASTDGISKMNGKNIKNLPEEGEPAEITLNLGALRESIAALQAEIDEELSFEEDELAEMLEDDDEEIEIDESLTVSDDNLLADESEETEEVEDTGSGSTAGSSAALKATSDAIAENDITDALVDSIVEKLTVDMGADLSGWAGRSSESMKWEMEKEMAHRRGTEVQEELEDLKKAQEELVFENKQLKERLSQYEQVTGELKETLQNVNLSNARLLYTNRVLRNTSLNERQKSRIVDAISKAGSVAEARTIHNTLENTVQSALPRRQNSLSETISRPTSVIRASREEKPKPADVFVDRMRQLAGIQ